MRNERPLVSFTFDDIPASAAEEGCAVLEHHGARGTFYVAAGLAASSAWSMTMAGQDAIRALSRAGHEVGCHTFSHPSLEMLDEEGTRRELDQNRQALAALDIVATSFAYPFGIFSYPRKRQIARAFSTCRSVMPGVHVGAFDPGLLRAVALYQGAITMAQIDALIERTVRRNGWLIFFTHDVAPRPSDIGCSPGFLSEAVSRAQDRGCTCLPVADAFREARESAWHSA